MNKRVLVLLVFVFVAGANDAYARSYQVASPSGRLRVTVTDGSPIEYSIQLGGRTIVSPSPISLSLEHKFGWRNGLEVLSTSRQYVKESIKPVVPGKRRTIIDEYHELRLQVTDDVAVLFRAYDEGVAYRWSTTFADSVTVSNERATFQFPEDAQLWFSRENSVFTSQEAPYGRMSLDSIGVNDFASAPVLVGLPGGCKVLITEADLRDYPGMFLQGSHVAMALEGKFAGYPLETREEGYRHIEVAKHADYLAKTTGDRTYPWRVLLITDDDRQLVNSDLIYKLSPLCELDETSWIKPGKVVWDWWNAQNIRHVDFEAGINTKTYKHYIDFAAEHGIEYFLIDEGWSEQDDLTSVNPDVDIQDVIQYAKSRNVDLILWVIWKTLDRQMAQALDQFKEWGVAGIKVDFMSRDDQWMVNFYQRVAREAAKRRLVVDFHGSYKPTGLRRAFPNVLTRESVRGLEYCKWSDTVTPEHNVTLPFIRMVAGPLDYTPGAMRNALGTNFRPSFERPSSRSTRCHQLAMYVVYESPLQMLADSPSNYRDEPKCLEFIKAVPTVSDETHLLAGQVSDHIVIARHSGRRWFVGGMTGDEATTLEVKLDFLPAGQFHLKAWEDGLNTHRHAEDFRIREMEVSNATALRIRMSQGGGWAAIIE